VTPQESLGDSCGNSLGSTNERSLGGRTSVFAESGRSSIDITKLSADPVEQKEFARQIDRLEASRILIVYDQELTIKIADGAVEAMDHCYELTSAIGRQLNSISAFAKDPKILGVFQRVFFGERNSAYVGCFGRQFGLRTHPLKDLSGNFALGVGILRELTEESIHEGIERRLRARLSTLVDSMDSGILVEDEKDVIQHCNQHFCGLMQVNEPPHNLVGQRSRDVIERISSVFFIPEALAEGIEELKKAKKVVKDELVYLADMRILERSYAPLELDGNSVGHFWTYRDVTDRERNKDLLQRQADELRALSLVDELTGLYNRRGFLTIATQQLKLCDRSLRSALVIFVDLDGMKRINDELGHEYGDIALVETASVLRQCFRYSDVVARLGGDEFVVLAVEADPPNAEGVIERLYEKLAEMNQKPERKFELKFSVGIAPYDPSKSEMVEEVLARADGLMYEQKRLRKRERKD
jgi:diguanylate cyclase (GGDEF)-like protein